MIEFLREHEVAPRFKAARRDGSRSSLAVSFWGKGAAARLGLTGAKDARVLCNLDHVGCNPVAIQELRALGIAVRTYPRLHAKIYAGPSFAIVGSSNASTNGLTVEGSGALGWAEGSLMTDDPRAVADALAYFKELWDHPETRKVTKAEIEAALARPRAKALALLDPPKAQTLLAACRERPKAFEGVIVLPYTEPLSGDAKARLDEFRAKAVDPGPESEAMSFRNAWAYEAGDIPKRAWIVDLDCRPRRRSPKVWGCSREAVVLEMGDGSRLTITARGTVRVGGTAYKLPPHERRFLEAAGKRILKASDRRSEGDYLTLAEAIRIADKVAAGR